MVRRSTFLSLGGFNEQLGASCEDWEFCVRLASASPIVKVTDALVRYHYLPSSASRQYKRMLEKELSIEQTLLGGTSGLSRALTRRKLRSAIYSRAATGRREGGQSGALYLLRSIYLWPSLGFLPRRYKQLGVEIADLFRYSHRRQQ
jgi:GT2 family glycosyltransferase